MWRRLIVIALLVVGMMIPSTAAFAQDETPSPTPTPPTGDTRGGRVEIHSPRQSEIVQGSIQIVGTAVSPEFDHYELHFAPDPPINDAWTQMQPHVTQQVREVPVGVWDTTRVTDGLYLIRLRMVRADTTFLETSIRVQVANATPTPTFTPVPPPTSTLMAGPATAGPSPTPLIQQPPTRTPRPTATPGGPTETPVVVLGEDSPFRPERIRQAAWNGVWYAVLAFVLIGLYIMIRVIMRGQLRVALWRLRTEVINPLLERQNRRR